MGHLLVSAAALFTTRWRDPESGWSPKKKKTPSQPIHSDPNAGAANLLEVGYGNLAEVIPCGGRWSLGKKPGGLRIPETSPWASPSTVCTDINNLARCDSPDVMRVTDRSLTGKCTHNRTLKHAHAQRSGSEADPSAVAPQVPTRTGAERNVSVKAGRGFLWSHVRCNYDTCEVAHTFTP